MPIARCTTKSHHSQKETKLLSRLPSRPSRARSWMMLTRGSRHLSISSLSHQDSRNLRVGRAKKGYILMCRWTSPTKLRTAVKSVPSAQIARGCWNQKVVHRSLLSTNRSMRVRRNRIWALIERKQRENSIWADLAPGSLKGLVQVMKRLRQQLIMHMPNHREAIVRK